MCNTVTLHSPKAPGRYVTLLPLAHIELQVGVTLLLFTHLELQVDV